jgi:hypothetical protein
MTTFTSQSFTDCELVLDGNEFCDCTFTNVALVYKGGPLPAWSGCTFSGRNGIKLDGAAINTVNFLSGIYNHLPFGKRFMEDLFDRIRIGV